MIHADAEFFREGRRILQEEMAGPEAIYQKL